MKNYIQPGRTLTIPAPANVTSGGVVQVGKITGIAAGDALAGQPVDIACEGVFTLPKASASVLAIGDEVAWSGTECEEPSTGNDNVIGAAVAVAGSGATSVAVRLAAF
ncbi:hypothetical protein HPO_19252 [Hyphomonas polymorpha PS728]|uniref:RecA/RadA recombinase n=1 Tax=Hyphomonas polymorpha PS728 TaxID=1280954 RepID=A0A062VDK5_9PROT|nr:capsid cement protein [Hyphomonas polymorpha]KCZ96005.1 hypothetical protein HPO_19252 [Hyphomonas polymorpha PS728]